MRTSAVVKLVEPEVPELELSAVAREALGRTQARGRKRGGWRADGSSGAGHAAAGGWGSDSDEGGHSDVERGRAGARRLCFAACWQSTGALHLALGLGFRAR